MSFAPLRMRADKVCVDSLDNKLYFNYFSCVGCIGVADCSRNIVTSYLHGGSYPTALCYDVNNNRVYFGTQPWSPELPAVTVIDCSADTVVKRILTSDDAQVLKLHAALNKLYVTASYSPDILDVIDCKEAGA